MKRFLAVWFVLSCFSVLGQLKPYSYYVNTGLADQKLYSLSKDHYGRLLLATDKGVYSYNGFKSKPIDLSGLSSSEFTNLVEVGTTVFGVNRSGQLVSLQLGKVNEIVLPDQAGEIKWIKTNLNKLIICTRNEVFRCSANPFKIEARFQIPFLDGGKNHILDYAEFANESYVLLSSNELVAIKNKMAWTVPGNNMRFLVAGTSGLTILPTYLNRQNAFRFKNARFKNLKHLSSLVSKKIERVVQYNSKLFFCSELSLLVYDLELGRTIMHIPGYAATDIFQEKNGTIWVSTLRKGLICIPNGDYALSTTNEYSSLSNLPGENGFVGINSSGELVRFSSVGKEVEVLQNDVLIDANHVQVFNSKQLLASPFLLEKEGKWKSVNIGDQIKSIHATNDGILIAGNFGLRKYEVHSLDQITSKKTKYKTILQGPIRSMAKITDDQYLILGSKGLERFDLSSGKLVQVNYYNQHLEVLQLANWKDKVLVLTGSNEILVYSGQSFTNERDLKEVNPDIKIQRFKVVGDFVYLLSDNTLYRYEGLNGEIERLEQLSTMNGLYLRDFVAVNSAVFVATQYGVFKFDWRKETHVLPTFIVGNPFGNYPVDSSKNNLHFTYNNSWVKIPFEVVELGESHPFVLQYRLIRNDNKADNVWINSSIQLNELSFEHLEGGEYRLELRLKDPYSSAYSSVHKKFFKVEYHWLEYKWIWFVFGVLSTIVISGYIRDRELKKRLKR